MKNKKLVRVTLMMCVGITLLIGIAGVCRAQPPQDIRWAARLYPHDTSYVEVYVDARRMTISERVGDVVVGVAFFDQAGGRMQDDSFTLPMGRLTRYRGEAYRSFFKRRPSAASQAVGTVLLILAPSVGSEEEVIRRIGSARASVWDAEMNSARSLDPTPPSVEQTFAPIPMWPFDTSKSYFITSVSSRKVMDAQNSSQDDWVPIIQTTRHEGSSQQWRFEPLNGPDEGYYHIRSVRSDKCLDVKLGDKGDRAAIIQYLCADGEGQKWALFPVPGHAVQLVAKHSGKAIDVDGAVSDDVALIQFTRHLGANQQWTMEAGETSASVPPLELVVNIHDVGDRAVGANEFAGTRGESRPLEGFRIKFNPPVGGLSFQYLARFHGNQDFMARDGEYAGARREAGTLEEFAIELIGPEKARYDVYYMAHIQDIGDTPFSKNGEYCGSRGQGKRIEGMLVKVVPK